MNPLIAQIDIGGAWRAEFFLGLFVCICYLVKNTELPLPAKLLWVYILGRSAWTMEFPTVPFGVMQTAFEATAGMNFAEVLLIPLVALMLPAERELRAFRWVIMLELILVWLHVLPHSIPKPVGLMVSRSFDLALIALYVPFAPTWLAALSIFTIITHHGSTALMILGAEFFAWSLINLRLRYALLTPLLAAPALLALAIFHSHSDMLDGGARIREWQRFMFYWAHGIPKSAAAGASLPFLWPWIIYGVGPGTFMWCSLMIDNPQETKQAGEFFMHCEWLQIPFELGAIGLILALLVMMIAAWRARRDAQVLAGVFGIMAFAVTYHPLRWFFSAFLCALIVARALKIKRPIFR